MVAFALEYLVSHGKTGALGRFVPVAPVSYQRGDRVLVQSDRGLSIGTVLCPATDRQTRLLGAAEAGKLLRRVLPEDERVQERCRQVAEQIFAGARRLAMAMALPLEILDIEMSLDGRRAILQYLAAADCDPTALLDQLTRDHDVQVWLENLAAPPGEEAEEHGGCGKPDCGRKSGGEGEGCSTCSSGGGCSSCGSGKVDMKDYFSHLRDKMENRSRKPLL
jgi:cell fate regulator YaaT (PSP1 superfamily)